MADCCDSTEFEWIETNNDTRVKTRSFQFLKEGYLHTSVKEEVSLYGTIPRRRLMGKRASEPSMLVSGHYLSVSSCDLLNVLLSLPMSLLNSKSDCRVGV